MARKRCLRWFAACAGVACVLAWTGGVHAQPLFVRADADEGGNGESWASAFNDLQLALAKARNEPGDWSEIWVKEGTYKPSEPPSMGGSRFDAYDLVRNVTHYGGFAGDESSPDERNPAAHVTILSGDLEGDDLPAFENRTDNSLHVIRSIESPATTSIDGFTVKSGFDNVGDGGGGVFCSSSVAFFVRLRLTDNGAFGPGDGHGGALFAETGFDPPASQEGQTVVNCEFFGNRAIRGGALASGTTTEVNVLNTVFRDNTANFDGGAVYVFAFSRTDLVNCTIVDNDAMNGRGGGLHIANGGALLANSIAFDNTASTGTTEEQQLSNVDIPEALDVDYCLVAGWTGALDSGAMDTRPDDPEFANPPVNYRLKQTSPGIDSGNNPSLDGDEFRDRLDLDGNGDRGERTPDLDLFERIFMDDVDRGAYEFHCPGDITGDGIVDFDDLLEVLSAWDENGYDPCPPFAPADVNQSCRVDFDDLLVVLDQWSDGGGCFHPQEPAPDVDSREEVIASMGLTEQNWADFLNKMQTGTPEEKENYACWMDHYYYAHYLEVCICAPSCPSADPWGNHHRLF